ncbi:MAG: glycosyltransferase family 4 protein [Bacteroidales bacterium]|jgi:glycosyltransferase involved in cell wall biosynthesis|nr:glycosyltransferase family 4 protein [Bacteroidales bacterium]
MKIAINTRLLLKNKLEGIGRFTYETVKRLCENHPEHTFYLLFDRMYAKEYVFAPNVVPIVLPFQSRHPFLWWFWFHVQVPRVLKSINADVFISTDGYVPLNLSIPVVNVIHDLNFEHNPQQLPTLTRNYYLHFFPKYARAATRIATVSTFSKIDISTLYGIDPEKIDVVYNGVSSEFTPLGVYEKNVVKQRYTGGEQYFVYVGSLHPRKNIERLLLAFEKFKQGANSSMKLLIVGEAMFMAQTIRAVYEKSAVRSDIIFTGRASNTELAEILAAAYALVYVPLFEGFGIPIVEAFACNVPVITSNTTSMPEVGGDAALLVNPENVSEIAEAMHTIVSSSQRYEELQAQAHIQLQKFSWNKTAAALWNCVEKAVAAINYTK